MDENKVLDGVPLDRYNELLQKEAYLDLILAAQNSIADYQIKEMLGVMAGILWGAKTC